jgi:hypothetical protein
MTARPAGPVPGPDTRSYEVIHLGGQDPGEDQDGTADCRQMLPT